MTEQEKMEELVDVLEMDLGEFDRDTVLEEVETWNSVAVLSFIALMNEKFDKIFFTGSAASWIKRHGWIFRSAISRIQQKS